MKCNKVCEDCWKWSTFKKKCKHWWEEKAKCSQWTDSQDGEEQFKDPQSHLKKMIDDYHKKRPLLIKWW